VNHGGEITARLGGSRLSSSPRRSPDDSRIALEVTDGDKPARIWVLDEGGSNGRELTTVSDGDHFPGWANNGELLFTSWRGKDGEIWRWSVDGSGAPNLVYGGGTDALVATDVHKRTLIFQDRGPDGSRDIFALDLDRGGKPQPLLHTAADE